MRHRADPNRRTRREEPELGLLPFVSALDLAVLHKHNGAAKVLIEARARLDGGYLPAMHHAGTADNVEAIQLLYEAGVSPQVRNSFGYSATALSATSGAQQAVQEMLRLAPPGQREASMVLFASMSQRGGTALLVYHLVTLKADIDFQFDVRRDISLLCRLLNESKALQHRVGKQTLLSTVAYHQHGMTPLMFALLSAQHEGAAALIALGARLDLQNCRGLKAADVVPPLSLPEWLRKGLQGDPEECQRLSSLALPDGYVRIAF